MILKYKLEIQLLHGEKKGKILKFVKICFFPDKSKISSSYFLR
jgi:hypothetical protein